MENYLAKDLQTARDAAQAGAKLIRSQFGRSQDIQIKRSSNTIVTATDRAAEAAILEVLRTNTNYSILSEESGLTGDGTDALWIVDPLDGTSNFARSLPLFAVSVALVRGAEILAGVIIDPVHETEYFAVKGEGAYCNNKLIVQHKNFNNVFSLFLNHGSKPEDKSRYAEITRRLHAGYNLRKLGTTALELCFVASGFFDGFICSGDEIWDYAAGALIASEAGNVFTDWKGQQWDGNGSFIMVVRPELHAQLSAMITDLQ